MYVDQPNATSDTLVLGNEEGGHTAAQKIPGSSSVPGAVPPTTHCLSPPRYGHSQFPSRKAGHISTLSCRCFSSSLSTWKEVVKGRLLPFYNFILHMSNPTWLSGPTGPDQVIAQQNHHGIEQAGAE